MPDLCFQKSIEVNKIRTEGFSSGLVRNFHRVGQDVKERFIDPRSLLRLWLEMTHQEIVRRPIGLAMTLSPKCGTVQRP